MKRIRLSLQSLRGVFLCSIVVMMLAQRASHAQSLIYIGQTSFDVSIASYNGASEEFSVSSQELGPTGLAFNDDGTKMFVIGSSGDAVVEYSLSVAFDVSTASYSGASEEFSIASEETNARCLAFNNDGSRMFVLGDGDSISEYDLSTGFDVSTATYNGAGQEFSVAGEEINARGLVFNTDGTKMFIVGVTDKAVVEYSLSTPFDVSTATHAGLAEEFSVASQVTIPQDLAFNFDGTKMYVVGSSNKDVVEYTLSVAFDVSTASHAGASEELFVGTQESVPEGIAFSNDGTKLFVIGSFDDRVVEYAIARGTYVEAGANDGSIDNTSVLIIDLEGDTFQDTDADNLLDVGAEVTIGNIPSGLTAVMTLSNSDSRVTLTFTGNADSHTDAEDVSDLTFVFDNSAFTGNDASAVSNSGSAGAFSSNVGIDFENAGSLTYAGDLAYTETSANTGALDNSNPLVIDLTGDTFQDSDADDLLDVGAEVTINNIPAGLTAVMTLSNGDTRVTLTFTGNATSHSNADDVEALTFEFDNSAFTGNNASVVDNSGSGAAYDPNVGIDYLLTELRYYGPNSYDISDAAYAGEGQEFSVGGQETGPTGMAFSQDGLKMFVIGSTDDRVVEYTLTTAFDVSTATHAGTSEELVVSGQELNPQGLAFNNDGTKLFIVGNIDDAVVEYSLSRAFDVSTATYAGALEELSVAGQDTDPRDIAFNDDGTLLFVLGANDDRVVEYSLSVAFDVSTATHAGFGEEFSVAGEETVPLGLAFNFDGTKMFVVGSNNDIVLEYDLSVAYDVSTATFAGTDQDFSVGTREAQPQGLVFNSVGSILNVIGSFDDSIIEFTIAVGDYLEDAANNDGSIDNTVSMVIEIVGDTFQDSDADNTLDVGSEITINNVPAGLTASVSLSDSDTRATLTFTGTATNNDNADDVAALTFVFDNTAFTTNDAGEIDDSGSAAAFDPGVGIDFLSNIGPGGVFSSIALWLKADAGTTGSPSVTAWDDQSVNANTSTSSGAPQLTDPGINFNPVIAFDGNDSFALNDPSLLPTGSTLRTYFLAGQSNTTGTSAGQEGFFSHGTNAGAQEVGITFNSNNERMSLAFNGVRRGISGGVSTNVEIAAATLSSTNTNSLALSINGGGQSVALLSGTDAVMNTGSTVANVATDVTGTNDFDGNITEIVVYSTALSASNRQRVESYLAIRNGVTLSGDTDGNASAFEATNGDGINEGDYVASDGTVVWDASSLSAHHNNVTGIGRDDNSTLIQLQSMSINSDAIVSIGLDDDNNGLEASNSANGSSFTVDRSFLVWGHDNADLNSGTAGESDFDPEQVKARLNREWRVQETGTVGTVVVQFDVSGLLGPDNNVGTNDESQIVLLVDADGDFTAGASTVAQSFVVDADGLVNFRVDFSSGSFFTLGSSEQSALPVTLMSFNAEPQDDRIKLFWQTASETNNSFFEIQRSSNGVDFESIGTRDGAGTSHEVLSYTFFDMRPLPGNNYYRLVDVSRGGDRDFSEVIVASFDGATAGISVYPNPVKRGEVLKLDLPSSEGLRKVEFNTMLGLSTGAQIRQVGSQLVISTDNIPTGLYLCSVWFDNTFTTFRILVRE